MRHIHLGPRRIACCAGLSGLVCWADWLNHAILGRGRLQGVCDRHEKIITNEVILDVYWNA